MSRKHYQAVSVSFEPGVVAAQRLWADADNRSLSRQIAFIVLRALYRRGIDPTAFSGAAVGSLLPAGGEPYTWPTTCG